MNENVAEEGFESARWLSGWAKEQQAKLHAEIEAYLGSEPSELVREDDPQTGRFKIKVVFREIPTQIRGLTNDLIKNLRDALDQSVNAASTLVTGQLKRNRHFPFGQSPDDFDVAITMNQCRHIPSELYAILKSFEPFPTGDGWTGGDDMFRLLGSLAGAHKHRIALAPTIGDSGRSIAGLGVIGGGMGGSILFPTGGKRKPNEIVMFDSGPGGVFDVESVNVSSYITFAQDHAHGTPLCRFSQEATGKVIEVVAGLEREAKAISM